MIVNHLQGNMLDPLREGEVLVCPVNTVGVMGKGLALEFKVKLKCFEEYRKDLAYKTLFIGQPTLHNHGKYSICYFPTKINWMNKSKLDWIYEGLVNLTRFKIKEPINLPPLGCGLGGLNKDKVKKTILYLFEHEEVTLNLWNF